MNKWIQNKSGLLIPNREAGFIQPGIGLLNKKKSAPPASFVTLVNSLSPIAWWRMGDSSGSFLNDTVANEHAILHTTYTLGVSGFITGDTNTAVTFSSGYAQSSASNKWSLGTTDFSVFLIAKWTSTVFATIGSIRDGTSNNILCLFTINRTATGQVGAEAWNWNSNKLIATDKSYNDNNPHALGLTYQNSSNTMRLYVDGVLKVTQVQTGSLSRPVASTMSVQIGSNYGSQNFPGTLDENILFNYMLSDANMNNLASYVV